MRSELFISPPPSARYCMFLCTELKRGVGVGGEGVCVVRLLCGVDGDVAGREGVEER